MHAIFLCILTLIVDLGKRYFHESIDIDGSGMCECSEE